MQWLQRLCSTRVALWLRGPCQWKLWLPIDSVQSSCPHSITMTTEWGLSSLCWLLLETSRYLQTDPLIIALKEFIAANSSGTGCACQVEAKKNFIVSHISVNILYLYMALPLFISPILLLFKPVIFFLVCFPAAHFSRGEWRHPVAEIHNWCQSAQVLGPRSEAFWGATTQGSSCLG